MSPPQLYYSWWWATFYLSIAYYWWRIDCNDRFWLVRTMCCSVGTMSLKYIRKLCMYLCKVDNCLYFAENSLKLQCTKPIWKLEVHDSWVGLFLWKLPPFINHCLHSDSKLPLLMCFSHFDGVRSLAFHPVDPVLITASEDHTLKLWNLQKTVPAKK